MKDTYPHLFAHDGGNAVHLDPHLIGFDAEFYYQYYKDLRNLRAEDLIIHYKDYGISEGRFKNLKELLKKAEAQHGPIPNDFNREGYKAFNKDLSGLFRYDWECDVHYIEVGRAEGRRYKKAQKTSVQKNNESARHRYVYVYRGDGIGTRLLTVIYAKILADLMGLRVKVIWHRLGSPFYNNTLFDPKKLSELFVDQYIFRDGSERDGEILTCEEPPDSLKILNIGRDREKYATMNIDLFEEAIGDYDGVLYEQPGPALNFMNFEQDIASEVKRIWNTIAWGTCISNFVNSASSSINIGNTIAVHIRRGDIVNMILEADIEYLSENLVPVFHRYTALKTIMGEIDKLRNDERMVICSDDSIIVEAFAKKYGRDKVYSSREGTYLTEDQISAVDIILLSRSKMLLSPLLSFFSKCAAEVGECKYNPIQFDLSATVGELVQIADTRDKDVSRVKELIYTTAASLATDEMTKEQFVECARLLAATALSSNFEEPHVAPIRAGTEPSH